MSSGREDSDVTLTQDGHFAGAWVAEPDSVSVARHAVADWLRRVETKDPPLGEIEVAVSEAVTNAVVHAYLGGDPGEVRVRVAVLRNEVELIVEDDGRGMLPRTDSPGLGLGLPLIATLSDRFDAESVPGGGTRLSMWFLRHPPSSPGAGARLL
jgi:anti-sigma regulatory factor (Ser/Thr protein kinase)